MSRKLYPSVDLLEFVGLLPSSGSMSMDLIADAMKTQHGVGREGARAYLQCAISTGFVVVVDEPGKPVTFRRKDRAGLKAALKSSVAIWESWLNLPEYE